MLSSPASATQIKPLDNKSIKIIQITDTHVLNDGESVFDDFDTSKSLSSVIDAIKRKEGDADAVLVTGDLVHTPSEAAYQKLADHLASVPASLFCLPGNHDDRGMMNYVLGNNGFDLSKTIIIGNWVIVLLDTHVSGEHAGKISDVELELLHTCLAHFPEHNVVIALHHHPVSIDSAWMDAMSLTNPEVLFAAIEQHGSVRGVIWGHIHQAFELTLYECLLLGTPSTCLQFKPGSPVFAVDDRPPGYRKLTLLETGKLTTEVKYVTDS